MIFSHRRLLDGVSQTPRIAIFRMKGQDVTNVACISSNRRMRLHITKLNEASMLRLPSMTLEFFK